LLVAASRRHHRSGAWQHGTLLIDTGSTLTEARAIDQDVQEITHRPVSHIVLTHNHFDHILGSSAFGGAAMYCASEVAATINAGTEEPGADAVRHGANAGAGRPGDRRAAATVTPNT